MLAFCDFFGVVHCFSGVAFLPFPSCFSISLITLENPSQSPLGTSHAFAAKACCSHVGPGSAGETPAASQRAASSATLGPAAGGLGLVVFVNGSKPSRHGNTIEVLRKDDPIQVRP